MKGIAVNDEALAVDLVKELGFNGGCAFSNHARAHVRELWSAKLSETRTYQVWRDAGSPSTVPRAQARVAAADNEART